MRIFPLIIIVILSLYKSPIDQVCYYFLNCTLIIHMQKNGLNNAHHLSGVPRKQQMRHAFLHSMHTLVIEKIARAQRKNLQLSVKVKELL